MNPAIFYTVNDLKKYIGKPMSEIYHDTDTLRKKVKEAAGYQWDNSHNYITGVTGHTLAIGFQESGIYLYSFDGYEHIADIKGEYFTEKDLKKIHLILDMAATGHKCCNKCKNWIKPEEAMRYSFAGIVCRACFDPAIHKAPLTN